jgi:hypothetical protein
VSGATSASAAAAAAAVADLTIDAVDVAGRVADGTRLAVADPHATFADLVDNINEVDGRDALSIEHLVSVLTEWTKVKFEDVVGMLGADAPVHFGEPPIQPKPL